MPLCHHPERSEGSPFHILTSPLDLRPSLDGTPTLFSARYGQTYGSTHGALVEARHVFLDGSGTAERLAAELPTRLLEVGFGTGLNVAATIAAAGQTPLEIVSLEHDLLPAQTFAALGYGARLGLGGYDDALVRWRRSLPDPFVQPASFVFQNARVTVVPGDARTAALGDGFHAVYLDAFSPDANPELWTSAFLARLFDALVPGGRLATYCARGVVRCALADVGFAVAKRPGPPGKRDVLTAQRPV